MRTAAACAAFLLAFGLAGRLDEKTAREQEQANQPALTRLPAEDEQGWSCRIQGNWDCGLANPFQGPALTAAWAE